MKAYFGLYPEKILPPILETLTSPNSERKQKSLDVPNGNKFFCSNTGNVSVIKQPNRPYLSREDILAKIKIIEEQYGARFNLDKIVPKVCSYSYKPNNKAHNDTLPIEDIQFEFLEQKDQGGFKNYVNKVRKSSNEQFGHGGGARGQYIVTLPPVLFEMIYKALRENREHSSLNRWGV